MVAVKHFSNVEIGSIAMKISNWKSLTFKESIEPRN